MAQVHTVNAKTKGRKPRRVGRGGKRGTYSGRGMKGQRSRSGHRIRPEIRDMIKSLPKLQGRAAASGTGAVDGPAKTITLRQLKKFGAGASVTPKTLAKEGYITNVAERVKIVATGDAPKKLHIVGVPISKGAAEKVAKAGGKVE